MNRASRRARMLCLPALLAGAAALATARQTAPAPRPNVVVIVVDDLRFDDFGAAGHPWAKTPHIDRLAREGAMFVNSFAVTPLCSPSRANILTGQHTRRHGILDNTERGPRSHQLPTFARELDAAGYRTGFIGKWHMGNDPTPRPGFDSWVAMKGQGEALDPELFENGRLGRVKGYVTDIFTDRALRFIEARDGDGSSAAAPFMLMLSHKALHPNILQRADGTTVSIGEGGFIPAERHRAFYAGLVPPRRGNYASPPRGKPALERRIDGLPPLGKDTVTPDETIRDRLRMLAAVDESLGRILASLEASRKLDDTVVILLGDNGYFYGEHGLSEERRLAYEESIRVPILVRYPRAFPAGSRPSGMALTIDVAPTIVELASAPPMGAADGRSLTAIARSTPRDWRRSFLVEYTSDIVFPRILRMGYDAVRTERHLFVRYRELPGMEEMYDLEADPFELRNLATDPAASAARRLLETELDALIQRAGSAPHGGGGGTGFARSNSTRNRRPGRFSS